MVVFRALSRLSFALLWSGQTISRFGASLVFVLGGEISPSAITLGLLHPAIRAVD